MYTIMSDEHNGALDALREDSRLARVYDMAKRLVCKVVLYTVALTLTA